MFSSRTRARPTAWMVPVPDGCDSGGRVGGANLDGSRRVAGVASDTVAAVGGDEGGA